MATSRTIREEQAYIRGRRHYLIQKRERLIRIAGPNAFGKGQSYLDADAIHADHHREAWSVSQEIIDVNTELKELREQEYALKHHLQEVKQVVDSDCDLNFKIRVLHDFIGLNLREVAEELGMSYDRVRHVAADLKRNAK